jgi:hypothetical protein
MGKYIEILESELNKYAKPSWNGESFLTFEMQKQAYAVIAVSKQRGEHMTALNLMVRLIDDCIVIDTDRNDKPLVDALVQAGIPREQIVLAYAGEALPESARS